MRINRKALLRSAAAVTVAVGLSACESTVDDRIPSMVVNINLGDTGMWNTYGVAGTGIYRYFVKRSRLPEGFPYTDQTATGYGGVLLVGGMDPFQALTDVPLAYDLSCPVECSQTVLVGMDPENLEAVCDVCGSRYDVVMSGGAPVAGPALTGSHKYGLRRYNCRPVPSGGYILTN